MNNPERIPPYKNRRKGPDWLVKILHWLSLAGWALFIVVLGLTHLAKPEFNYGVVQYWGLEVRDYWDPKLTPQLIYLLWWCCSISLSSIILNHFRMRRVNDRLRYNFVALLLISLGALSFFYQL